MPYVKYEMNKLKLMELNRECAVVVDAANRENRL